MEDEIPNTTHSVSDNRPHSFECCARQSKNRNTILLHDSICKDINLQLLLKGNRENSEKTFTPTTKEVRNYLQKINQAETTIMHVGINDLKTKPVDVVCSELA